MLEKQRNKFMRAQGRIDAYSRPMDFRALYSALRVSILTCSLFSCVAYF